MKSFHHSVSAAGRSPGSAHEIPGSSPSTARPWAVSAQARPGHRPLAARDMGMLRAGGSQLANNIIKAAMPTDYGSLLRVCLGTAVLLPSPKPQHFRQNEPRQRGSLRKGWGNGTRAANSPCQRSGQHRPHPVLVPNHHVLQHRPLGTIPSLPADETVTAARLPTSPQLLHTCPETEMLHIWTS